MFLLHFVVNFHSPRAPALKKYWKSPQKSTKFTPIVDCPDLSWGRKKHPLDPLTLLNCNVLWERNMSCKSFQGLWLRFLTGCRPTCKNSFDKQTKPGFAMALLNVVVWAPNSSGSRPKQQFLGRLPSYTCFFFKEGSLCLHRGTKVDPQPNVKSQDQKIQLNSSRNFQAAKVLLEMPCVQASHLQPFKNIYQNIVV